jgi:uncharacterized protein YndB with AHSA1/START domain
MSVTNVEKDLEGLSLTLTAEFDASVDQVWDLWADPRKLERWWGPPGYPATFNAHDLSPGGDVGYFMTSPEGDKHHGWWRITSADPPSSLEFDDGFGDEEGKPAAGMPVTKIRMRLSEHDGGTRMELTQAFENSDQMQQVIDMGGLEGLKQSVGQMDAVLAAA